MQNAADRLCAAGADRPLFEAQLLLAHAMHVSRGEIIAGWPPQPGEDETTEWLKLVDQRASRVPIAYLLGYREFHGRRISVTPDVLVPRPETELLVERTLSLIQHRAGAIVIDVCTGSGCVAASIAKECADCWVCASDISLASLRVAAANARNIAARSPISLAAANLLSAFASGCADVITANPPYIPTAAIASLEPEVRDYEPRLAVDGGEDGLMFIRPLTHEAMRVLRPGGTLLLEVGQHQAGVVMELLGKAGCTDVMIHEDLARIPRMIEAVKPHE